MTNQTAERLLLSWLESEAPTGVPEGLHNRIDLATRAVRPRPAWLARLEGHHMDIIQGGRRATGAPRLALIVAVIGLLAVLAGAAIFSGAQRPSQILTPTRTGPSPSANAQQSARPTAKPRAFEPGDPIPDELIGEWYVTPSEVLYIMRGPSAYCQKRYNVLQDCWTWTVDDQIQAHADILTIVDGKLRDMSIGRQDCAGDVSTMTFQRNGNTLELNVEPGSCFTRDFPTMFLIGSGQVGVPASVPPLHWP